MITVLSHIFYILTCFWIVHEINILMHTKSVRESKLKLITDWNSHKDIELFDKHQKSTIFNELFYTFWLFAGFFSMNWLIFLATFIISFFTGTKQGIIPMKIGAVLCIILYIFMLINTYHLHIDYMSLLGF